MPLVECSTLSLGRAISSTPYAYLNNLNNHLRHLEPITDGVAGEQLSALNIHRRTSIIDDEPKLHCSHLNTRPGSRSNVPGQNSSNRFPSASCGDVSGLIR
jgi:hypothetical protein